MNDSYIPLYIPVYTYIHIPSILIYVYQVQAFKVSGFWVWMYGDSGTFRFGGLGLQGLGILSPIRSHNALPGQ